LRRPQAGSQVLQGPLESQSQKRGWSSIASRLGFMSHHKRRHKITIAPSRASASLTVELRQSGK
jgi:hypothetical protein